MPKNSGTPKAGGGCLGKLALLGWTAIGLLGLLVVCVVAANVISPAPRRPDNSAIPVSQVATGSTSTPLPEPLSTTEPEEPLAFLATATDAPTGVAEDLPTVPPAPTDPPTDVPPTATPRPEPFGTATENVLVRSGPGTNYARIASLSAGERVELLAVSQDKAWFKHNKGWTSAFYLRTEFDLGRLPIELVAPPPTLESTRVPPISVPPTPIPPTAVPYVAPEPQNNCHPSYSPCVPIASDVDCAGGSGNGPAYVRGPVRVLGGDPYGLDRDGDGWGCE